MNKKLQKQIKAYAGLAGAILSTENLDAQVVVTDYIPPLTDSVSPPCNTVDLMLDMDLNGIDDFDFRLSYISGLGPSACSVSSTFYRARVLGLNGKVQGDTVICVATSSTYPGIVLKAAAPGILIDNTNYWMNSGVFDMHIIYWPTSHYGVCPLEWPGFGIGCLPVKFLINGMYHFGWVRMQVSYNHIEIFQSGYQLQPNVPVLACDTTNLATGFSEHNQQQFSFSQQNNSIHISTFQKSNHAIISVFDLLGKEILQQTFEGKETTITIDKKGIYFVEVKSVPNSSGGIFRKKVFIY